MKPLITAALAALLIATSAPAVTAQAGYEQEGTITVTPPTPRPGEAVTVAVTGCSPAPGTVDVRIDGVDVGTAQVGADGSFEQDFIVPLESEGPVLVEVFCADEVLSAIIDVQVDSLPFQEPDDPGDDDDDDTGDQGGGALPRTGTDTTRPLVQLSLALIGLGVLLVLAARRRSNHQPAHQARHAASTTG